MLNFVTIKGVVSLILVTGVLKKPSRFVPKNGFQLGSKGRRTWGRKALQRGRKGAHLSTTTS